MREMTEAEMEKTSVKPDQPHECIEDTLVHFFGKKDSYTPAEISAAAQTVMADRLEWLGNLAYMT